MSPVPTTTKRATALPPEARRAAIIDAVRPLLVEHGERLTSRQIADAAGIAEGTIFRVFADKDELVAAAVEAALDPAPFESAVRSIDAALPLAERLTAVVELSQQRTVDIAQLVSSLHPARREQLARPLTVSPAVIELFESEGDALRVAPAVAAKLVRSLTLALTHPMLTEDPATPSDIVDVVLHGIANHDERGQR